MSSLQLPRHIANQLLEQALSSPDVEICGLIASRDGIPSTCYPITNAAIETERQFQLDPRQHIEAMRQMRENGETLFAIYHSHPSTPAIPSRTDIEQANHPDTFYLIISTSTTGSLHLRGFLFNNNELQSINVTVCDHPEPQLPEKN